MSRIHYGWVICILGMLLIFVTMGVVSNGFSVFLPFIMKTYGLTHAQTSSLITLRCLVAFIAMLCIGLYYSRLSIRVGTTIAAACAGIAFFIYSYADTYLMFCIGAAVSGLSYGWGSMIPVSILMAKWFMKHRTLAIGICTAGSGIATIILPPITTFLIERLSIKTAFLIEGAGILIITIMILIFMRNTPSEKSLEAYGRAEVTEKIRNDGRRNNILDYKLSRKEWILLGCVCLTMGALANPGFSHLPVLYTTEGFSSTIVAIIISSAGAIITLSKILFGEITDKIGGKKASLLFGILLLIGHVLCCFSFTQSLTICIINILFLGIGYPLATIGPSVWAGEMASPLDYATVVRRLQIIYAGGALIFASVPGIIADYAGGYIPAYCLFAILLAISLILLVAAFKENVKRKMSEASL